MMTGAQGDALTELELDVVAGLGNGSETTLLVFEMVNGVDPEQVAEDAVSEERLVETLFELERRGLVSRRTDHHEAWREFRCGIPEWEEGRTETLWWDLTEAGKCRLEEESDEGAGHSCGQDQCRLTPANGRGTLDSSDRRRPDTEPNAKSGAERH
jgi:hypothetical protein